MSVRVVFEIKPHRGSRNVTRRRVSLPSGRKIPSVSSFLYVMSVAALEFLLVGLLLGCASTSQYPPYTGRVLQRAHWPFGPLSQIKLDIR